MKKYLLLNLLSVILIPLQTNAVLKTWIGASGGNWSVGTNWSPSGTPAGADDVVINTTGTIVIDVNPNVNSVLISAAGTVQFTASAARTITVSSTSSTTPGLQVNSGAVLQMAQSAAAAFDISLTGSVGVTGRLYGTLQFTGTNASASAKLVLFTGAVSNGNMIVYSTGIIQYDVNTGNTTGNGLTGLQMEAGSQYILNRNGGFIPAGTYNNGSVIRINGVTGNGVTFNTTATYQGLIIWNCTSQTISGSSAIILPSNSFTLLDSLRIVNTGTGTVRLATNPNGFVIGHLEVQGGTLEIGSPASNLGVSNACSITSDFIITGGTVIGNATYTGDNIAGYAVSLTVNGNFTQTGGTFNLTNRPTGIGGTGGAFLLYVKGNVSQTAGAITCSSAFGSQNQVSCNGTAMQDLRIINFTGSVMLVINNTSGVSLQDNLVLPSYLQLAQGYLQLNSNNCTITYPGLIQGAVTPTPKIVTNGFGKFQVLSMPASVSQVFPIAPDVSSYNPVTIAPQAGATTNSYYARVESGVSPPGIMYGTSTINRTWIINSASTITANQVNLTFQYAASEANSTCSPTGLMELGHYPVSSWNIDPAATFITPAGSNPYTVGTFAPNSFDSAFVVGNKGSILASRPVLLLKAIHNGTAATLLWKADGFITGSYEVESSSDGLHFTKLAAVTQTFLHVAILPGNNYYRIKSKDNTGADVYSNTVALIGPATGARLVSIFSAPASSKAVLSVFSSDMKTINIAIADVSGAVLFKKELRAMPGKNSLELNIEKLAGGVYIVYGTNGEGILKFIKQ